MAPPMSASAFLAALRAEGVTVVEVGDWQLPQPQSQGSLGPRPRRDDPPLGDAGQRAHRGAVPRRPRGPAGAAVPRRDHEGRHGPPGRLRPCQPRRARRRRCCGR
ncbi:hypothetical protein LT493_20505 [Streptomyces tricolor]|nr:hypothetical protein [Streptomyces tricolor]